MNSIVDILIEKSSAGEVFVVYQEEPDIVLYIPFTTKNGVNINNSLIIGENFIENKLIFLEKSKIIGINWFKDTQENYLNQQKIDIYKKIELYDNLINDLKFIYNYDKKFIIYDTSEISLFKIPFNVRSIKEIETCENIEERKAQFKLVIKKLNKKMEAKKTLR